MALKLSRNLLAASAVALALSPVLTTAASAQSGSTQSGGYQGDAPNSPYPYPGAPPADQNGNAQQGGYSNAPQGDYNNAPPPGYNGAAPQGYNNAPPPGYNGAPQQQGYADLPPPQGYDGTQPPPPPPGYQPNAAADLAQRDADARYAADAERWSRDNCVKSHGNVGAGAVIGGIVGALVGNGLSGRHDRGAGTFAGAAVGAVGGAAIASSANGNQTSPGCPPGFVVRNGAPSYGYDTGYDYAAPGWYRPWIYTGGIWTYRPYPYHNWYYRNYRGGWGGGHGGYYGRPGGYGRGGYGRGGYGHR